MRSICQQGALLFPEEIPPELGLPGKPIDTY